MIDRPGNVIYKEFDRNEQRKNPSFSSVVPARYLPTLGRLMLPKLGQAPRVALIIREQVEGEPDPDPQVADYGTYAATIAASRWDFSAEEAFPRRRCNYEWRWWPGDWWAVWFRFGEVEYSYRPEGTEVVMKSQSEIIWQEEPGKRERVGSESDPESWERIPTTQENSTVFPTLAEATDGLVSETLRTVEILWPLSQVPVIWEAEGDNVSFFRPMLPGPLPPTITYRQHMSQEPGFPAIVLD